MVGLSTLPPEILAHILTGEASYLYVMLWKCGDRMLNGRLAQGGCSSISLIDHNIASTSRFPSSLRSLHHLQELVIQRNGVLGPSLSVAKWLQELPSTLQKLDIECEKALMLLLRSASVARVIRTAKSTVEGTSNLWNIKQHFPTLRWLGIQSSVLDKDTALPYALEEVKDILPDTLTYLSLSTNCNGGDLNGVLPPNLETLKLKFFPLTQTNWPASLTHIEHCQLSAHHSQYLADLPRALRQLALAQYSTVMAKDLPPTLTSLEITGDFEEDEVWAKAGNYASWLDSLPRTLTLLSCLKADPLTYGHILSLPRTLLSLKATIAFGSLDQVYIENGSDLQRVHACWPPHLHTLTTSPDNVLMDNKFLKYLPNTLTRLLDVIVAVGNQRIESSAFEWTCFPDSLKELSIKGMNVAFIAPLPDLVSLEVAGVVDLCDNKTLPSSLTSLCIASLAPSEDASLKWPVNPIHVSMLPPTLRSLEITSKTSQMSPVLVAQLPSSLTSLHQRNTPYEPAILEVLPFGLRHLSLNCQPLSYPPHFGTLKLASVALGNSRENPFDKQVSVSLDNWPQSAFSSNQNYFTCSPWKSRYEAIRLRSFAYPDPRMLYTD